MTCDPANIIGDRFGKLGTLEIGSSADIVLIDTDKEWTVNPLTFASKGKNTPLSGTNLKGKVVKTFYQGKVVFSE